MLSMYMVMVSCLVMVASSWGLNCGSGLAELSFGWADKCKLPAFAAGGRVPDLAEVTCYSAGLGCGVLASAVSSLALFAWLSCGAGRTAVKLADLRFGSSCAATVIGRGGGWCGDSRFSSSGAWEFKTADSKILDVRFRVPRWRLAPRCSVCFALAAPGRAGRCRFAYCGSRSRCCVSRSSRLALWLWR